MATLTEEDIAEIRAHVRTVSVLVRANDGLAYHRNNALRAYDDRVRLLAERDELIADRAKQSARMDEALKRSEAALRKVIRNHHLSRPANEAYFKRINQNWDDQARWFPPLPRPESIDPLIPALAFIEAAEDEAAQ